MGNYLINNSILIDNVYFVSHLAEFILIIVQIINLRHELYYYKLQYQYMISNYYQILGVQSHCSIDQISQHYRKLSLRYHPKTTKENPQVAAQLFSQLAEAYQVLSDPIKRAFYDKYGYQKLKVGLFEAGQLIGGYRFANNAEEIFQNFFKNKDTLSTAFDRQIAKQGSIFGHAFGGLQNDSSFYCQNLIVYIPCTLQQLYNGTKKSVHYYRKMLNNDGRTTTIKSQVSSVHIKPGYSPTTLLIFPGKGHETVHRNVSDLYFQIQELPHHYYKRNGDDLIYSCNLNLIDALDCKSIEVPTLDGRHLTIGLDQIATPQVLHEVTGQGFINETTNKKGNLYIKFNINFPEQLSEEIRKELRGLLP